MATESPPIMLECPLETKFHAGSDEKKVFENFNFRGSMFEHFGQKSVKLEYYDDKKSPHNR